MDSWFELLEEMPASVANSKTPAQVDQHSKFVTVLRFLQSVTQFLRIGYKNYAVKITQFNSAMSDLLKNAITGTDIIIIIYHLKSVSNLLIL